MDPCPSCRHNRRRGYCSNRRCSEFEPCDPAVRAEAVASIRRDVREGLARLRSLERTPR